MFLQPVGSSLIGDFSGKAGTHIKILHLSHFWRYIPDHTHDILVLPVMTVHSAVTIMHVTFPYIGPNILTLRCGILFDQIDAGTGIEAFSWKPLKWFSQEIGFSFICTAATILLLLKIYKFTCLAKATGGKPCFWVVLCNRFCEAGCSGEVGRSLTYFTRKGNFIIKWLCKYSKQPILLDR